MKIAIIGCGYVGTAIASVWTRVGHEVTATTTNPQKVSNLETVANRVVVLKGNNPNVLKDVIENQEVVLLSVAAKNRSADGYRETYLETAKNLVNIFQENKTVRQVIYTGSYAVLGDKQGAWIDEAAPVAPVNENGEVLLETEEVLLSAHSEQLKVCIIRIAGIYGPGRELIKIFRSWAGTTRPGKGDDYTNWVHLDDIVRAISLAQEKQLEGIYHLVNDTPMTTKEFCSRLFEIHGLPPVTWDASTASIRPYNSRLSNRKIKAAGLSLIHPETEF